MSTLPTNKGMKTNLSLTVAHKMFHNDQVAPFGKINATVNERGSIRFSKPSFDNRIEELPDVTIRCHQDVMREHVRDFLKDRRYPVLWNEESGWETQIREVA